MRRSKLEMQVDILKILAEKGPLPLTSIIQHANLSDNILKENLAFLIKQGLIEEVALEKKGLGYGNTNRGTAVVRFFSGLGKTFPANEESKFLPVSY
jgi:predicted transcriptional regulator